MIRNAKLTWNLSLWIVGLWVTVFAAPTLGQSNETKVRPGTDREQDKLNVKDADTQSAASKSGRPQDLPPISPEQRREIRRFVRDNLPELERVFVALSQRNPRQFQRVMNSVNESYNRLQTIKKSGNEAAYANALENWKLDARIKMAMAQLSIKDSPAVKQRLRRLITKQIDGRLAMMRDEKARLQARLANLESNLTRLESERDSEIERRVDSLLDAAEKSRAERQATRRQSDEAGQDQLGNENPNGPNGL